MASCRPWFLIGVTLLVAVAAAALLWPQQDRASATGGPQMSFSVKSPLGQCDAPNNPTSCDLPLGTQFNLSIAVSQAPPEGYSFFQTQLFYGDLIFKPTTLAQEEIIWPDAIGTGRLTPSGAERTIIHAAQTGAETSAPISHFEGNLVSLALTCPQDVGSFKLALISNEGFPEPGTFFLLQNSGPVISPKPIGQQNLDLDGDTVAETVGVAATLDIRCLDIPTLTPTPTPTGPTATALPTDTPAPTPSGPPSMSFNVRGGACDSATMPTKCTVTVGDSFVLAVVVDQRPPQGYIGFQTFVRYGDLLYKPTQFQLDESVWPDSAFVHRAPLSPTGTEGEIVHGDLSSFLPPYPVSTYTGSVIELDMTCPPSPKTIDVTLVPFTVNPGGAFFAVIDPVSGSVFGVSPQVSPLTINCVPPPPTPTPTPTPAAPSVLKSPQLSNLFLTAQGAKIPPATCLGGTDAVLLTQAMDVKVGGVDKAGDARALGGFSFKVNYDETKVCIVLSPGPLAQAWVAAGGGCIIQDSLTKPTLQGTATITCNSLGKAPLSLPGSDNLTLAFVTVKPMPDEYSVMRPNNGNGNVVQIINKACKLTDRQGDPIAPLPGAATCTDADITVRYLEGDVAPDCVVDTLDTQAEAFRWGAQRRTLLYHEFFNVEPSKPQQDDDIDINDLQFVYGRFGSTCASPHPKQNPVNPKAG